MGDFVGNGVGVYVGIFVCVGVGEGARVGTGVNVGTGDAVGLGGAGVWVGIEVGIDVACRGKVGVRDTGVMVGSGICVIVASTVLGEGRGVNEGRTGVFVGGSGGSVVSLTAGVGVLTLRTATTSGIS